MNKFHTTVSRRDFMKAIGFGAAGLGAASATAPVFHDLDEVISKDDSRSAAQGNQPWFVKERPYMDPTTEVDWNVMEPFRADHYDNKNKQWAPEEVQNINRTTAETKAEHLAKGEDVYPGFGLRADALFRSVIPSYSEALSRYPDGSSHNTFTGDEMLVKGYPYSKTPEQMGLAKWSASPEENARMTRTIARFFGASDVRFLSIDDKFKKLLNSHQNDVLINFTKKIRKYVFEDVDNPYVTDTKAVIPNRFKYAFVLGWCDTHPLLARPDTQIESASVGTHHGCFRGDTPQLHMQRFMHNIGYTALGGSAMMGIGAYPAAGVCSGFGELGRLQQTVAIKPAGGNWLGSTRMVLTDLPLPASNPIDAGIVKFCKDCDKCAEICPGGALQHTKEPSWDLATDSGNSNLRPELFNNPGKKTWNYNHARCQKYCNEAGAICGKCGSNCVFNKEPLSSVHDLVLGVVSKTNALNGFFFNMDKAFGYGEVPKEQFNDFWHMEYDMPQWGVDRSTW